MKQKMVLGIFQSKADANNTVLDLRDKGYEEEKISIITRDTKHVHSLSSNSGSNVTTDAATGGMIGALAGLLIGVAAIAIPGLGGILVGGPVAAILGLTSLTGTAASSAITGALVGSLAGGLIGIGLPEGDATQYESSIKEGGTLVIVPLTNEADQEAKSVMKLHNAQQLNVVNLNI